MTKPMLETRRDRNERLKREGRWSSFLARRESLKSLGSYTPEAAALILDAEFGPSTAIPPPELPAADVDDAVVFPPDPPPMPASTRKPPGGEDVELADSSGPPAEPAGLPDGPMNFDTAAAHITEDTLWAYQNFANPKASIQTAPRPSAFYLLEWAKTSKAKFFGDMVPKLVKTVTEEAENRRGDDGRKLFALLDRFQQQAEAGQPLDG